MTIEISKSDYILARAALSERPFREVAALILRMDAQAARQLCGKEEKDDSNKNHSDN